jgi:hypothetical protein
MKIIDRLPFADRPHLVTVRGEAVDVYRNQIIVWISIDDVLRPLPAILDTGFRRHHIYLRGLPLRPGSLEPKPPTIG